MESHKDKQPEQEGVLRGMDGDMGTHSALISGDRLDGARVDDAQEEHRQVERPQNVANILDAVPVKHHRD